MSEITTEWRCLDELTVAELYELLRFRQSIFVVEQRSPYPDLDGLDQAAWHLLLQAEGSLVGYLRLIPVSGPPSLVITGRVAVSRSLRGRGLGRRLVEEALVFCRDRFAPQQIALGAQLQLVPFYESFGFVLISEPYEDFGVAHVKMELRLHS